MQVKRQEWKIVAFLRAVETALFSQSFLCPMRIPHDPIVQAQCHWCEWSCCVQVKSFMLAKLTMCPGLPWTVCIVDKSVI